MPHRLLEPARAALERGDFPTVRRLAEPFTTPSKQPYLLGEAEELVGIAYYRSGDYLRAIYISRRSEHENILLLAATAAGKLELADRVWAQICSRSDGKPSPFLRLEYMEALYDVREFERAEGQLSELLNMYLSGFCLNATILYANGMPPIENTLSAAVPLLDALGPTHSIWGAIGSLHYTDDEDNDTLRNFITKLVARAKAQVPVSERAADRDFETRPSAALSGTMSAVAEPLAKYACSMMQLTCDQCGRLLVRPVDADLDSEETLQEWSVRAGTQAQADGWKIDTGSKLSCPECLKPKKTTEQTIPKAEPVTSAETLSNTIALNSFLLGKSIATAALLRARESNDFWARQWQKANEVATEIGIPVAALPKISGSSAKRIADGLHFCWEALKAIGPSLLSSYGVRSAAFFEFGLRTIVTTELYVPDSNMVKTLANQIETLSSRLALERKLWEPVTSLILKNAPAADVKRVIETMQGKVETQFGHEIEKEDCRQHSV